MKHALLTISLLTLCCAAFAKDKSKTKSVDLTGSWKEVRRIDLRQDAIDYTDTTYYDFLVGNEYTTQRKHSFMYRGTYKANTWPAGPWYARVQHCRGDATTK